MPHKDPIAKREYMREYLRRRRKDPEFRSKANEKTMNSRRKPDGARKHREANARYKDRHPDRVQATMKKVDASPHRVASRPARRQKWIGSIDEKTLRAFQKKWRLNRLLHTKHSIGASSIEQWIGRCRLYGNRCAYCGLRLEDKKIEVDHVIPIAKGGSSWPSNLVPACRSCNARKSTSRWRTKLPQPTTRYFDTLGIPNVGNPPAGAATITDRLIQEQQMGLGMQVSPTGRKASGQSAPRLVTKES